MKTLIAICLVALPLCAQKAGQKTVAATAPALIATPAAATSTQQYSHVFQNPRRDAWQQPDAIVAALGLASTDTAAEMGSGAGYFARRMALQAKKVYVIDDSKTVLDQATLEAPANLTAILADRNSLHIPPNSIDKLVINGLLELSVDDSTLLSQIQAGLKPTAKIYVVDFFQSSVLPLPANYAIPALTGVFQLFGFRLLQDLSIVSHQDLLVFGH